LSDIQTDNQTVRKVVRKPSSQATKQSTTQTNSQSDSSQRPYYEFPKQSDENEVNILALFYEVLSHYKRILLIAIVGAVLGALVGFLLYQKNQSYEPDEYELARINKAHSLFNQYKSSVNGTRDNFITSLDESSKDYVQKTLTYNIHMDEDAFINMATPIFGLKSSSAYLNELQQITGFAGEKSSLAVVLNTSVQVINNENSTILLNAESASDNNINLKENYAILTVTISYLTEEQCERFSKYVENSIEDIVTNNKTIYPGLTVTKVSDNVLEISSSFISNALATLKEQEMETITEYHDLTEKMSSEEMFYYNSLYDPEKLESKVHSIIKYSLLCSFGLVFLLVAYYAFIFVLSDVIRSEQELTSKYGLSIIGRVRIRPKKKRLAAKIQKKMYESSIDDCEPEYIANVLNIYNPSRLYMIATDADLYYIKEDSVPVFIEALSEVSPVPVISGSYITNSKLVRATKSSMGVCIIVIPGVTRSYDLRAQLAVCNKHKIFVQGIVILR